MYPKAIERWREIAKSRDFAGLETLLADDVVFRSPVVHTPQRGKAITLKYLSAALAVLGGEAFRYVGEWLSEFLRGAGVRHDARRPRNQRRRHDRLERGRADRSFQGDGAAAEGDQRAASGDGGEAGERVSGRAKAAARVLVFPHTRQPQGPTANPPTSSWFRQDSVTKQPTYGAKLVLSFPRPEARSFELSRAFPSWTTRAAKAQRETSDSIRDETIPFGDRRGEWGRD